MKSPAQAHRMRSAAALSDKAGAAARRHHANGYELMLAKLDEDRRRLKQIQSVARKIIVKREVLPEYEPWISGVLAANSGVQDDVLMTIMLWRIDVADFPGALAIARYAIAHHLVMPDRFERSTACLIVEEIAIAALQGMEAETDAAPCLNYYPVLAEAEALTQAEDMPDEVRAKLYKALALAVLHYAHNTVEEPGITLLRKQQAMELLRRALTLHERCGVKKDIERLERDLKKSASTEGAG